MAHLQIRGKRMSGKKVPLVLGKTIDLEVWGPINALASPSHEYQLISSDPGRVELAAGSLNTRANLRLYKATAKTFGTATVMIQEGDLEIDFVDVQVLPNPSNVPFASWYAEVLPGIMRALRARGRFAGPSIENKAGFFIAQAFSEQSPGAVGDPSANGNRLFNVQALVTRDSANRITGVVPGQTDDGVSIQNLRQGEGKTEETRVKLASPTFVYDSTERAVALHQQDPSGTVRGGFSGDHHVFRHLCAIRSSPPRRQVCNSCKLCRGPATQFVSGNQRCADVDFFPDAQLGR
jgi:hypothetical protein